MLLAIDVGNTHTAVGVFSDDRLVALWNDRMET
jgi:pantothenate kinase type III